MKLNILWWLAATWTLGVEAQYSTYTTAYFGSLLQCGYRIFQSCSSTFTSFTSPSTYSRTIGYSCTGSVSTICFTSYRTITSTVVTLTVTNSQQLYALSTHSAFVVSQSSASAARASARVSASSSRSAAAASRASVQSVHSSSLSAARASRTSADLLGSATRSANSVSLAAVNSAKSQSVSLARQSKSSAQSLASASHSSARAQVSVSLASKSSSRSSVSSSKTYARSTHSMTMATLRTSRFSVRLSKSSVKSSATRVRSLNSVSVAASKSSWSVSVASARSLASLSHASAASAQSAARASLSASRAQNTASRASVASSKSASRVAASISRASANSVISASRSLYYVSKSSMASVISASKASSSSARAASLAAKSSAAASPKMIRRDLVGEAMITPAPEPVDYELMMERAADLEMSEARNEEYPEGAMVFDEEEEARLAQGLELEEPASEEEPSEEEPSEEEPSEDTDMPQADDESLAEDGQQHQRRGLESADKEELQNEGFVQLIPGEELNDVQSREEDGKDKVEPYSPEWKGLWYEEPKEVDQDDGAQQGDDDPRRTLMVPKVTTIFHYVEPVVYSMTGGADRGNDTADGYDFTTMTDPSTYQSMVPISSLQAVTASA